MHPRSEEVVNYLDQIRTELRAAVDSVPSEARNQKPAPDQWSVAQVLDHVAIVHNRVAIAIGKWIAEAQAAGLGQLEQAREKLRAAFLSGDGLALEQVVQPHPVLGPINIYQWTLFNGSHEARHALQIREIGETFTSRD